VGFFRFQAFVSLLRQKQKMKKEMSAANGFIWADASPTRDGSGLSAGLVGLSQPVLSTGQELCGQFRWKIN